ncbi:eS24 family ribosomal protein [Methanoplanus limicola]|uniref:30S ribosomal protein S24e n=1 Tax=Methanoplanus limicola DSM 2279 TaxID=937775 RepID=H1Z2U1_9EURY|nr:hypothetical protein [Methanoplanus limicola]EHQ34680.1 hypothetical protein Metlim_0545 [Methanoplanus limicola DSM 2279]
MTTIDINFTKYEESVEMKRKDIEFTLNFEGAIPARKDILDEISLCYGAPQELVALDKLRTVRGKKQANGKARIYPDSQTMKRCEKKPRK